ncbi:uncharacterized protein LOC123547558 [Mercenaria mercenaria]|uniref:uncharacterized protein LOC123547558 n=1 Tax=Mercenaria mercenaria TaxID=6596 RepID=UPI00234F4F90|nr:uncharacterized protein LOC123547558 [Mercenaria mercenaria]XP_053407799.1 uncharacterized protein LOC123547558 [Mercenaria mercenaria]
MSSPRHQCEMRVPEALVEKMESLPGGIRPILSKIEKEFGLKTTSSYNGIKVYIIVGPNPDILELAIETLQRRYFAIEDKGSDISGEIDAGRRAVWKFQGDYAFKASQLFRADIEEINKIRSVHVHVSPLKIEFTASYDDVEQVKAKVDQLQADIDSLVEADITIVSSHAEIIRLREFIQRKTKYDKTVVCILNEQQEKLTVFAKTEDCLRKVMNEWESTRRTHSPQRSSPSFSYASSIPHPRFKSEMKIPGGIVKKLEKQRDGISYILGRIEKEFGLKVDYVRKKHLTIFGPHLDILELAAQTLIYRYVIKSSPENGVLGQLQGQNAVWRFLGTYAKKVVHLFAKDVRRLKRVRTVTIKATPCKVNPTCLEILCSARVVEIVKSQVEKLVGLVHNLFEQEIQIPDDIAEIHRAKHIILEKNESKEVLCVFDDNTRKLTVLGKSEILVLQVVAEFNQWHRKHLKEEMMPEEYRHMYRHLYQMRIADDTVHKLENQPGGIMPMIQKIEKEYGVKTLYHRKKQMILISPAPDVLELVHETLESRYVTDDNDATAEEVKDNKEENKDPVETRSESKDPEGKGSDTEPSEQDLEVHTIPNRHYSPVKSRGHSRLPQRSIQKSSSRSPNRNKKSKKVVFA